MAQRLVDFLSEAEEENWATDVLPKITHKAAREKNKDGRLPLHLATRYKSPLEVVAALLLAYPKGAREKDKGGRLPLHYAAENQAPLEVVDALLKAHPEGARENDEYGRLPLHLAAGNKAPLEVVAALLKAYPEGAREKDGDRRLFGLIDQEFISPFVAKEQGLSGRLPLHVAALSKAPLEVVDALLKAYPDGAREKDFSDERLPLHWAAANKAPLEVVAALLKTYPEGAREKDNKGLLPLELNDLVEVYVQYRSGDSSTDAAVLQQLFMLSTVEGNVAQINTLLQMGVDLKQAAKVRDKDGRLPFHWVVLNKAPLEVVAALLKAFPEGAREKDGEGRLPLHLAAEKQAPLEMVDALLKAYPEGVREKDNYGQLPFHLAAANKAPLEVVDALLKAYPEGAREKDGKGRLPLHWALEKQAPLEMFAALLKAYPEGAREKDKDERLPLHVAAENKAPLEVVDALLKAYPEGAREKDKDGRLSLLWAAENQAPFEVVDALLKAYPEGANICDNQGRTATYLAATHPKEDGGENPCFGHLIDKHDAVFLSKHAARLTDREKHIRALEFLVLATLLGGGFYGYLVGGKNLTTTCDTIYHGMLLQPYLFDFVTVFLFKVVQFAFEEVFMPGLDFLGFATGITPALADVAKWTVAKLSRAVKIYCCSCSSCWSAKAEVSVESDTRPSPDSKPEQRGDQKLGLGIALVTMGEVYPDRERDIIPDATGQGITMNPLRNSMSGGAQAGAGAGAGAGAEADLENGRHSLESTMASLGAAPARVSAAEATKAPGITTNFDAALTSRALYAVFGDIVVKEWRKKKYRRANKTDPEYKGEDFWLQTPYLFLYLQATTSWISFIVAAVRVDRSLPAWEQYTDFCATIVNSASP